MKHNIDELARIIALGERYFECTLSEREEEELRGMLARTRLSHPAIDELRALTGFRQGRRMGGRRHTSRRMLAGIAAAVAMVVTLGIGISRYHDADAPLDGESATCIAYVNGVRITDEEDVIRQVLADMRDFEHGARSTADGFRDELGEIARTINAYETEYPEI